MTARLRWFLAWVIVCGLVAAAPAGASAPAGPKVPPEATPGALPDPGRAKPDVPEGGASMGGPDAVFVGMLGQAGGIVAAVTKRDNNVYLGMGPRMVVLNVSNPLSPTVIGRSVVLTSTIRWIQAAPTWAYVLDTKQLRIFDMSSPALPTLISSTPLPGEAYSGVYSPTVSGRWVWVANGRVGGLVPLDVTNPTAVVRYPGWTTTGQVLSVARSGNYLYLANGQLGLRVFSLADPAHPLALGGAGGALPNEWFNSVAVYGNWAYVGTTFGRFIVYDVTDPNNVVKHGEVYLANGNANQNIFIVNGVKAYVAAERAGLYAVDITNPDAPAVLGSYNTPGLARSVWVSNNYAYLADFYGMRVFDVSAPNPAQVAVYPTLGNSQSVSVLGNYAYVADTDFGLRVVSLSDVTAPRVVGSYNGVTTTRDVFTVGPYAYVAAMANGLQVINVSNPTAPVRCGFYANPSGMTANGVAVQGDYAYVADTRGFLRVMDVNPCATTQEVGAAVVDGATAVSVSGSYAYVAAGVAGLTIVNITAPNNPVVVSTYRPPNSTFALGVAVSGTVAFLASDPGGLFKINVSNPASPSLMAETPTFGAAQDVAVSGEYAMVADASKGIHVYSANTATLSDLGWWDTAGQSNGIAAVPTAGGVRAFIADATGGLYVFQISGEVMSGRILLPLIRRNAPLP